MSFNEFFDQKPTRRSKVRWDRVVVVGVLSLLVVFLLVKGVGALVRAGKDDSSSKIERASASESSKVRKDADSGLQMNGKFNITVCVDPGHGDYDSGTVSLDQERLEKDDNLRISLKLRDCLKEYGVNVVMTREDDSFLELEDRANIANNANSDFFICMHRNAYTGDMRGVEIWVNNAEPKEDTLLASNIMQALEKVGISDNRGICYGYVGDNTENYYVNNHTYMPSCLVELGFLTDDIDNKDFDEHINEYAKAIADAIIQSAVELGVIDKDGNRVIQGQFYNGDKTMGS